jgi:hypothetical protein
MLILISYKQILLIVISAKKQKFKTTYGLLKQPISDIICMSSEVFPDHI